MLTKDLLRYDQQGQKVLPFFVSPSDPQLLEIASALIDIFQVSLGQTREELKESTKHLVNSYGTLSFIMRGFEKLLTDRLEFGDSHHQNFAQQREQIFQCSASLIHQGVKNLDQYRQNVCQPFKKSPEQLSQQLYADLPAYQTVLSHRLFSPEQLIHRYNVAQIQGLLIKAKQIQVKIPTNDIPTLRKFCQYIRFYQLLAKVQKHKKYFVITIDGPLAMFHQTQKYGLNLAQLFPALLLLDCWELEANIYLGTKNKLQLRVNSSLQMHSHYRPFSTFVPDEIELFAQHFAQAIDDWKIEPSEEFLALQGEEYCFPDFRLTHQSGQNTSLEFFHAWHSAPLSRRLEQLQNHSTFPLIIGVAKHLSKKDVLGHLLQKSRYFQKYGFFFQKTPSLDKLKKPLHNILQNYSQQKLFS